MRALFINEEIGEVEDEGFGAEGLLVICTLCLSASLCDAMPSKFLIALLPRDLINVEFFFFFTHFYVFHWQNHKMAKYQSTVPAPVPALAHG